MGADEEQSDRHGNEELTRRRVEHAVVDLLPHREVVVGPAIEVERSTFDEVEHHVRAHHVRGVGEGPRPLVRYTGQQIVEELEQRDQNHVYDPRAALIHPRCIHVGQHLLIVFVFKALGLNM